MKNLITSIFPFIRTASYIPSFTTTTTILYLVFAIVLSPTALALDDDGPFAPTTPCVPSRTVDPSIETDIALGCQVIVDITEAVCTDYLAQQLPLAISQFCGNQSEAFTYCTSLPDTSPLDCLGFDPAGGTSGTDGEVYPPCTQEALDTYNLCGNSSGSGDYFATGDLVSLTQCLFLSLDLCTPEDGEGHFNTVFEGALTDCPIPAYTPACGVFSTAVVTAAVTTAAASGSAAATSTAAAAPSSSAAPSFQTTESGPPISMTTITSSISSTTTPTPTTSPSPTGSPPPGASHYFYLSLNGTPSPSFIGPNGSITQDPTLAQVFYILNGQLFTLNGLLVQASAVDNNTPSEPVPYILFAGSEGFLPFSTTFSLVTGGVEPSSSAAVAAVTAVGDRKRQIVGQTSLFWINEAFAAPGTAADFCAFEGLVYAVLLSEGLGGGFNTGCVPVALDVIYVEAPVSVSSSSESATTSVGILRKSCPIGQTLMAYTTVHF